MRSMFCLMKREFTAYFLSPIAYLVMMSFYIVIGYLFFEVLQDLTKNNHEGIEFPMTKIHGRIFWYCFMIVPPVLTMRLFAEERASGTLEMLMTAPIRDWQIVFAKFVAAYGFFLVMLVPMLIFMPVLLNLKYNLNLGNWSAYSVGLAVGLALGVVGLLLVPTKRMGTGVLLLFFGAATAGIFGYLHVGEKNRVLDLYARLDPFMVLTTYIALILAGALFISIGIFVSSLVKSQILAALLCMLIQLVFVAGAELEFGSDPSKIVDQVVYTLTIPKHFTQEFARGILVPRHLILYATGSLLFLFWTVRSVESRRWRQ